MTKAVLFDMDGLLVDTETLGIEVAIQTCKELGMDLTPDEQKSFIGVTDEKFYRELFLKRGVAFDIPSVLQKHFLVYEELLRTSPKAFNGAETLPTELKEKGYKLGLVSGSTANQIEIILTKLGIRDCFDVVVSVDDISHSKPDPEGYLLASQRLNIPPGDCVVLEDASTGIKAAKAAGMKVIGVVNKGQQDLSQADLVVDDLTEVKI